MPDSFSLKSKINQKNWVSRLESSPKFESKVLEEIAQKEDLSPILVRILLQRLAGNWQNWFNFLHPQLKHLHSPHLLPDMAKAIDRTIRAITSNEKILIHGDYDVDGICSVSLLKSFFDKISVQSQSFIPERDVDGYGISRRGIDITKDRGCSLLITCDCGINAVDEVDYANDQGLDVIITDHHLQGESLPKAFAVVNPQIKNSKFPFLGLCGTGVAYFFLIALRAKLREIKFFSEQVPEPDLRQDLDLVALATLADHVPLLEDNRILVSQGLRVLRKCKRPGICALLDQSGLSGSLTVEDLAFKIIPRINVAGRMNQVNLALDLLLAKDRKVAKEIAYELDHLNQKRREIQEGVCLQALDQVAQFDLKGMRSLVLWGEDWHHGVLGIVAARLSQKYHRPTVIIGLKGEEGVGSIRGVSGVNVVKAMEENADLFLRFGGHVSAAGLSIEKKNLELFRKSFELYMHENHHEDELMPSLSFDETLPLNFLEDSFLKQLNMLEPFGEGNPEPVFTASQVEICDSRVVGKNHLKLKCKQGEIVKDAIGFQLADLKPQKGDVLDLAFVPRWNEFRGYRQVQLQLKDLR